MALWGCGIVGASCCTGRWWRSSIAASSFFNTVGAVENIGFREPTTTSPSASSSSALAAACGGLDRGIKRSGGGKRPLDDKQQYFML